MMPDGTLLATLEQVGTLPAVIYYIHPDHLGGTNITTNQSAAVVQTLDYYPYGAKRIDTTTSLADESREFIGQHFDEESDLSYLNARYYDPQRGQFLSQDPVFWEVGQTEDGKKVLTSPQLQNSYSYAGDNPVTYKDPEGRCPLCIVAVGYVAMYAPQITSYAQSLLTPLGQFGLAEAGQDAQKGNYGMAIFGVVTSGEFSGASKMVSGLERQTGLISKIGDGANSKVIKLIEDTFKSTDSLSGGTVGAIKNEMMTGLQTAGKWHAEGKTINTLNRIANIFNDYNAGKISLKPIEIGIVKGIQKGIERAASNFFKSKSLNR